MTRRDHPAIRCTRCGVTVKEEDISLPDRCPSGERCPLNIMAAAKKAATAEKAA